MNSIFPYQMRSSDLIFFYKPHTEDGNHNYINFNPSIKILFDSSFSKYVSQCLFYNQQFIER